MQLGNFIRWSCIRSVHCGIPCVRHYMIGTGRKHSQSNHREIEDRLLGMVKNESDERMTFQVLAMKYKAKFSKDLDYKSLGFTTLGNLVDSIPSLSKTIVKSQAYICSTRFSASSSASSTAKTPLKLIQKRLMQIVAREANMKISISNLSRKYRDAFSEAPNHKEAGFSTLGKLIDSIPSLSRNSVNSEGYAWVSDAQFRASALAPKSGTIKKQKVAATTANGSVAPSSKAILDYAGLNLNIVDMELQLEVLKNDKLFAVNDEDDKLKIDRDIVVIQCHTAPGSTYVLVATLHNTYAFDCVKLGDRRVGDFLQNVILNKEKTKVYHDIYTSASLFDLFEGLEYTSGAFDTQLAMEFLTGRIDMRLDEAMSYFEDRYASTGNQESRFSQISTQRTLAPTLQHAVSKIRQVVSVHDRLKTMLGDNWDGIQKASDNRAKAMATTPPARRICFDMRNEHSVASFELLQATRPDDMHCTLPLEVYCEIESLLGILPKDLIASLTDKTRDISDLVLDEKRRPFAWIGADRLMLGASDRIITPTDLDGIVQQLGAFGSDNRATIGEHLHRLAAIRNKEGVITGLTARCGRFVTGNADIFLDILFGSSDKSILILGAPGTGKTTVVREITRVLSDKYNVCIVDSSNEIAGGDNLPHAAVGQARRLMVSSLQNQGAVMIECVQNHTPQVMVIDEIGRRNEVEAAQTCSNRGVRLVASAHGSLRSVVQNKKLRGLIGGVGNVTLSDAQSPKESRSGTIRKTKLEREEFPIFDVVVELTKGTFNDILVILDTSEAVDKILANQSFTVQRRVRDPDTGAITLSLETQ